MIPVLGRSAGEGNGMDRGAYWATAHGVAELDRTELLPGKSHRRRSLEGCSPRGHWGSDTTERLHFHFSLSCIGEGNGNPLQCSCLENPRDGRAWWAAIYGVTQSRTWLKWLNSSSRTTNTFAFKIISVLKFETQNCYWGDWKLVRLLMPGFKILRRIGILFCISQIPLNYFRCLVYNSFVFSILHLWKYISNLKLN